MLSSNSVAAFDAIAETYDQDFGQNPIGSLMRHRVWEACLNVFKPGDSILELNAGTGIDALFLAEHGIHVHAVDSSPGMISRLEQKVSRPGLRGRISFQILENEHLAEIHEKLFDGALSNFGGLNCVEDLSAVASALSRLLRPGARFIACFLNKFCLLEIAAFARRGKFRSAFRRWGKGGLKANVGGREVWVQYPSVRELYRLFSPYFELEALEGLGVVLPPTWASARVAGSGRSLRFLSNLDRRIGRLRFLNSLGDHVLLQLRRA